MGQCLVLITLMFCGLVSLLVGQCCNQHDVKSISCVVKLCGNMMQSLCKF